MFIKNIQLFKTFFKLTISLLSVFVFSCNAIQNKPTEQMGLVKLNMNIPEKGKGLFEFKNFKKLNGIVREFAGAKIYVMDFFSGQSCKARLTKFYQHNRQDRLYG